MRCGPFLLLLSLVLTHCASAFADEAAIRKNLPARVRNLPRIDEVSKTPIPGLYEVRLGTDIVYTDERGDHLIQGTLLDTISRSNLTQQRISRLTAIDFASLPLKDAIAIKQGTGARKLAVFSDPNCGYCKQLERELASLRDVTIYTFLYPVLGPDSADKANAIWCAKEPQKAWRQWMLDGMAPASTSACDTAALQRNTAFGTVHKIQGTPALVFEDGLRVPGAMPAVEVEKKLRAAAQDKSGG